MLKKITDFTISTLLGGLLVLVPLAMLVYLVHGLFTLVISVTDPIAELLPAESVWRAPLVVEILLLAALVAISFVSGLAMRVSLRSRAGAWVEKVILRNIPGYQVLNAMATGFTGSDQNSRAALILSPDGIRQLGVVVEDEGGEEVTVFLPTAPTGVVGFVGRVGRDRVEMLDAGLAETSGVLANWGIGLRDLSQRSSSKSGDGA